MKHIFMAETLHNGLCDIYDESVEAYKKDGREMPLLDRVLETALIKAYKFGRKKEKAIRKAERM